MRVGTHQLAVALWIGGIGSASACQCGDPLGMRYDEVTRWRLERATNVVQGRVVEVYATEKTVRDGLHVAVAKVRVKSIVRGEMPTGDLTLVTASGGDGSCSMSSALLNAVASQHDVMFAVGQARNVGNKREYTIDSCGYFVDVPRERASRLQR